jgi:hypothetical protein
VETGKYALVRTRGLEVQQTNSRRQPEGRRSDSRSCDELHLGTDQQTQHYDDNRTDDGQHDAQAAEYKDDVPLDPHDDAMYDDAPRARRGGGLATALALIGCAVLITGAYVYRSYYGNPSSTQPPPVITANNSRSSKSKAWRITRPS